MSRASRSHRLISRLVPRLVPRHVSRLVPRHVSRLTSCLTSRLISCLVSRLTSCVCAGSHVRAAWAGLRPLVKDPNADPNDTKKLSRDHVVDVVQVAFPLSRSAFTRRSPCIVLRKSGTDVDYAATRVASSRSVAASGLPTARYASVPDRFTGSRARSTAEVYGRARLYCGWAL
eukprot:518309-Rhodomonas_salina.1